MSKQVTHDVAISEIMQSLRRIFNAIQDYSHDVSSKFGITGPQLWAGNTISQNENLSRRESLLWAIGFLFLEKNPKLGMATGSTDKKGGSYDTSIERLSDRCLNAHVGCPSFIRLRSKK